MSDVSQGPGWWLASDGKWYPPHTAPQATLPPDASAQVANPAAGEPTAVQDPYAGTVAQQPTADPYGTGQQPAADPYAGQPGTYAPAGYQGQAYHPGYPPAGYAYPPATAPVAEAPAGAAPAPAAPAPERSAATRGVRWQPWAALAGIALIVWGAGQALLAWSEWHLVQQQFAPYGTVGQGHIAMALTAGGILLAGIAVVAFSLVMDRR